MHMSGETALQRAVKNALEDYFQLLENEGGGRLYQCLMTQVEMPLLEFLSEKAEGNQCKMASWLGLSRNTLRKLLQKHGIGKTPPSKRLYG